MSDSVLEVKGLEAGFGASQILFGVDLTVRQGEIAGVLGVYLSIPVMASLRIVWRRWRLYAEKRKFGPLNEYSFAPDLPARK